MFGIFWLMNDNFADWLPINTPFAKIVIHEPKYAKHYFRLKNENWVWGCFGLDIPPSEF
jgi:hypothetical protein